MLDIEEIRRQLDDIEKEMMKLQKQKQAILDEEKKKKEVNKKERLKEVEDAFNKYVELLNAYENDFNDEGYHVEISGKFCK